jgi:hypothetical protein
MAIYTEENKRQIVGRLGWQTKGRTTKELDKDGETKVPNHESDKQ